MSKLCIWKTNIWGKKDTFSHHISRGKFDVFKTEQTCILRMTSHIHCFLNLEQPNRVCIHSPGKECRVDYSVVQGYESAWL